MTPTTMWEVVAAAGRLDELVSWLRTRIPAQASLYCGDLDEQRVVVIDPTGTVRSLLADVAPELVTRPAHAWDFRLV